MPYVNLSNVTESDGARSFDIEPGAYVLFVTRVEPHPERQYAFVEWDVADGPDAMHYANSNFPPRDVVSWSERALPILKHKLHVLADANPGFDAEGAFYRDQWEQFSGKQFGAVIRKRLYSKRDGSDGEGVEVGRWITPAEVRAGQWKPMEPRDTRTARPAQPAKPAMATEDIPF